MSKYLIVMNKHILDSHLTFPLETYLSFAKKEKAEGGKVLKGLDLNVLGDCRLGLGLIKSKVII